MSAGRTIEVKDGVTPDLKKLMARTAPRALGEVIWPPALELTQTHLTDYKNEKGFPSQGFGEQLADKSYGAATDSGARVVIHAQGARQLIEGGTIKAVNKSMLCFGITAESYGHTLPELFGGAIPPLKQRSKSDKAKLALLRKQFAFAPEVTQPPHPDALPTKQEYGAVAIKAVKEAVEGGFAA